MFNISTPMSEKRLTKAGNGIEDALRELRPYVEKAAPELIYQIGEKKALRMVRSKMKIKDRRKRWPETD